MEVGAQLYSFLTVVPDEGNNLCCKTFPEEQKNSTTVWQKPKNLVKVILVGHPKPKHISIFLKSNL